MKTSSQIDNQTVELNLPSVMGYERVAMGCAASFAASLGFKSARIEDLKTAVAEACTNAIRHGNRNLGDVRVLVTMCVRDDTFHVAVTDMGPGIRKTPGLPDIGKIIDEEAPPGGLGLFLIQQLVDQVDFNEMTNKGHAVRMLMKIERNRNSSQ